MATCYACMHPARESIDNFYRSGRTIINGEIVGTAKRLAEVLARDYPNAKNPSEYGLLSHNKKGHATASGGIVAVITASGDIQLADGTKVQKVGVLDYLDTVIALSQYNMLKNPERVSAAQGNEAAALKFRIQRGVLDEDEIKDAWAKVLGQDKKKKGKKVEEEAGEPMEADYEVVE